MKYIYILLSQLIRDGEVRVDIPKLDMDYLAQLGREHNARLVGDVQGVVYNEELTDAEKVGVLQEMLAAE